MALLTREVILEVGLRKETVAVPEWGGDVMVRELSALEAEEVGLSMLDGKGNVDRGRMKGLMSRVVVMSVVNGDGQQLFKAQDVRKMSKMGFSGIKRVATVVMRMSGLGDEADLLEEAEKN